MLIKFIWNFHDYYYDVVIHLEDFHFMKENFQVMGSIIAESGFEDIVYQSNVWKSVVCYFRVLLKRMLGSSQCISEALKRLLLTMFLRKNSVPDAINTYDPQLSTQILQQFSEFQLKYECFRKQVKNSFLGKTAQFWIIYLNLVRYQHLMHLSVHENDFDLRLFCWKQFIPYYFALNKVNYARY